MKYLKFRDGKPVEWTEAFENWQTGERPDIVATREHPDIPLLHLKEGDDRPHIGKPNIGEGDKPFTIPADWGVILHYDVDDPGEFVGLDFIKPGQTLVKDGCWKGEEPAKFAADHSPFSSLVSR